MSSETKTYAVKVVNGQAAIYDAKTGVRLRTVWSNVASAQINGESAILTSTSGKVQIYSAKTGCYLRSL